jgi:hypothetical protein
MRKNYNPLEEDRMATVTDTKQTKTPLFHRASTTSTKSMAENVNKIAITTDNNHRQRNSVMENSAYDNNVKKIAITNVTDNKLPLLKRIDQVCYYITRTSKFLLFFSMYD